jgi:hypothetical protein
MDRFNVIVLACGLLPKQAKQVYSPPQETPEDTAGLFGQQL